jgi:putative sterol carrier protein
MAYDFPSPDWVAAYKEALNGEPGKAWQKAAETWEGDFLFIVQPDKQFEKTVSIHIDLWHGECRSAQMYSESDTIPEAEIHFVGTYANWAKLLKGEMDPIRGILMRKFKLVGNKAKVLQGSTAAKELVSTAQKIDTNFL